MLKLCVILPVAGTNNCNIDDTGSNRW